MWSLNHYILAASIGSATKQTGETISSVARFVSHIIERLPNWITAVVILVLSFVVAKLAKNVVLNKVSDKVDEEHQGVTVLAGRATYAGVLVTGVTIALSIAGLDLTVILAAVGFGISFAMQDLIMNFVAGVMILVARQFSIGDFIQVGNTMGQIEQIQSRYTRLRALDGTRVIVPNRDLFSNQVISYTSNTFRRIDIPVGVDYSTPLATAVQVCLNVINANPSVVKEPKPSILLDQFGGSSILLIARFWVDARSNWLQTKSELIMEIKKAFDESGIKIPFPIRTIYMSKEEQHEKKLCEAIQATPAAGGLAPSGIEAPAAVEAPAAQDLTPALNPVAASNTTSESLDKIPQQTGQNISQQNPEVTNNPSQIPDDSSKKQQELDETGAEFLK